MQPLLDEAPREALDAMLAAAIDRQQPKLRPAGVPRRFWPMALVASLALVALGAGLDRLALSPLARSLLPMSATDDEAAPWRRAVAQYLSLYTTETLTLVTDTAETRRLALAGLGPRLGLDLDPARVEVPGFMLKRAELFDYDGRPLGFLAYLDPANGPVSLCIIAGAGRDAPPRVAQRRGMTVVYWSRSGHGFMLIGRGNRDDLQARASLVANHFGGLPLDPAVDERG